MVETFTENNYHYHSAGRVWNVSTITWTRLPDSSVALDQAESHRIHRSIANHICGSEALLTFAEFEFLAAVTRVSFTDIAEHLDIHKSTISRWRSTSTPLSRLYSLALKRLFWFKLFSEMLNDEQVTFEQLRDQVKLLSLASQMAIDSGVTEPIVRLEAA